MTLQNGVPRLMHYLLFTVLHAISMFEQDFPQSNGYSSNTNDWVNNCQNNYQCD